MKRYELKSEEELAAIWKRQQHDRLFNMGDTLEKIKQFFASRDPGGGSHGERIAEGYRGNERGPAGG